MHTKESEGHRQPHPFRAKAVFDVVHRTTNAVAIFIDLAVTHGEHAFAKFCGGSKDRRDPHPKHSAGPADGNGSRHARNIARANS